MKKVITTMLVAAMVLSMAMPTSAATITRKKSTGTTASTTKVSGDYSLKMVDKTLQFIRGGKVVSSIETKDGKITLRKSSAGGISVVFTDANGKRRNITLGKQKTVALSGTFVQVSVDKALGSSYEVEMEKGSKVTNFYAKGAAKVTLNGSVTTLNVTSSNANVAANGTVSRAYAVNKKAISGMSSGKITQTSTGTSASGSVNTTGSGSSSSSNTTVNSGSGSGSSSSSSGSGIIINGGGSNNGGNTTSKRNPKLTASSTAIPTYDEGTVLNTIPLAQFGLKATYGNTEVAGKFAFKNSTSKVVKGEGIYSIIFTPTDSKTYNSATINVKINGKEVVKTQTLAEAKKAIEEAMPNWAVNNATTATDIEELAAKYLKDGITAKAEVTKVEATTKADGSIEGTIILTRGTETAEIKVKLTIPKLSALDEAAEKVEAALKNIPASKDIDKAAVEAVINPINEEYKDIAIVVESVTPNETDKKIVAKVTLTEDGKDPKTVEYTWTYTDPAENTDLADAVKAVEALKGPYADDTVAKEEIVKAAKAINQDIQVNTDNVVLSEDGTTVAGEVELSLTIGDKTETAKANFEAKIEQGEADKAVAPVFIKKLPEEPMNITINAENPTVLEVEATVTDGGEVTYQWYKNTLNSADTSESKKISGATGATYTPTETGNYYIYVVATNTLGGDPTNTASTPSKVLRVSVSYPEGSAAEPTISESGFTNKSVLLDDTKPSLSISATVSDGGKLSYQWYKTTSAIAEGGEPIEGATNATYQAPTNVAGTAYYYCVVTNTNNAASGTKVVSKATSKAVAVTVTNTVTMHATAVASEATTKTINLHFTAPIENLDTATAADYTVVGADSTHTADKPCTIKVEKADTNVNQQDVVLTISGVDATETAYVNLTKEFKGVSISTNNAKGAEVSIKKEADAGKVAGIDSIVAVDGKTGTQDTTQVRITFTEDQAIPAGTTVTFTDSAKNTITATGISAENSKTWLVTFALNAATPNNSELKLTQAGTVKPDVGKEPTVKVFKDSTPPKLTKVVFNRTNLKEVELWFDEPVTTESANTSISLNENPVVTSTGIAPVAGDPTKLTVTFADDLKGTASELTYTEVLKAAASIKDTSVAENKLASGTKVAITVTSVAEKVEIKQVETRKDNTGKTVTAELSMSTAVTTPTADTNGAGLAKAFTVVGSDGETYKVKKASIKQNILRSTPDTGSFIELTIDGDGLPAGVTIAKIIYNPDVDGALKLVDYFDKTKEVPKVETTVTEAPPVASDIKVTDAYASKMVEAANGEKNVGKYAVTMDSENHITVTILDKLVAWHTNTPANETGAPKNYCPIILEINKEVSGTGEDQTIRVSENGGTTWMKYGEGDAANAVNSGAPEGANAMVLWLAPSGDKDETVTYLIKTKDGESPITVTVDIKGYTGSEVIGMAPIGLTATAPGTTEDKKPATVKIDKATVPVGATLKYIVSVDGSNDPIKYGTSEESLTDAVAVEKDTWELTINKPKAKTGWEGNGKYYIHVYAIKDSKVVGYGVCSVPAEGLAEAEVLAASLNLIDPITEAKADDKNDMTIGASK